MTTGSGERIVVGCSTNLWNNPAAIVDCVKGLPPSLRPIEIEIEEGTRDVLAGGGADQRQLIADDLLALSESQGRRYYVHAPWSGRQLSLCADEGGYVEVARAGLLLALDFAQRVKAPVVTFHPGLHDGRSERENVRNLIRNIGPLIPVADEAHVLLSIETMGGKRSANTLLSIEAHRHLVDELGLGVTLDLPHAASRATSASDLDEYLCTVAPLVRHVHLGDTRLGVHRHVPIGLGELDLTSMLRTLAREGFSGVAVVEEWNKGHSHEEYVSRAAAFATHWEEASVA